MSAIIASGEAPPEILPLKDSFIALGAELVIISSPETEGASEKILLPSALNSSHHRVILPIETGTASL